MVRLLEQVYFTLSATCNIPRRFDHLVTFLNAAFRSAYSTTVLPEGWTDPANPFCFRYNTSTLRFANRAGIRKLRAMTECNQRRASRLWPAI